MAITIKGIRISSISVNRLDNGEDEIRADYQLVSSADKVLAKESLTTKKGYGTTEFSPSPATFKALREAVDLYRKDVEIQLGLHDA